MIPVGGLYETHLTVKNLARSIEFYSNRLGFELAHLLPEEAGAFFWIGGRERSMLGLWAMRRPPVRVQLHIAFSVTLEDAIKAVELLRSRGIVPRDGDSGAEIFEPVVRPWMPAASVYFSDPDGHSLEYIAILPQKPRPELSGIMPLSEWVVTGVPPPFARTG